MPETKQTEREWTAIYGYEYIVPLSHKDRPIGASVDPLDDEHNYAQVIATVAPDDPYGRGTQKAHADLIVSAPTLQAKIDRLEAEKAELVETLREIEGQASEAVAVVANVYGNDGDNLCDHITYIRNRARNALAKHEPGKV